MNAKELLLGKLNAGLKTIGMYLYGIMIGMPFNTVADILMSPTGKLITSLMDSNVFTGYHGCRTLDDAFNYLQVGPKELVRAFNNKEFVYLKNNNVILLSPAEKLGKFLTKSKEGDKESILMKIAHFAWDPLKTLEEKLSYIDTLSYGIVSFANDANLLENRKKLNKLVMRFELLKRKVKEYINQVYLIAKIDSEGKIIGLSETYQDIQKLAGGAEECKVLGLILGLNKGLKSKTDELIKKVRSIEETISSRLRLVLNEKYRKNILRYFNGDTNTIPKKSVGNSSDNKLVERLTTFTIEELLINPKKIINAYEAISLEQNRNIPIKHSFNIFDCALNVPHFAGYLQTLIVDHVASKKTSPKYEFIYTQGSKLAEKFGVYGKDAEQAYKNLELYYSDTVRKTWMKEKGFMLALSKGEKLFTQGKLHTTLGRTEIILGTPDADATYKIWFEQSLLPELKRKYPYNKFIQDIQPLVITKTISHNSIINYSLPINMMPHTDSEQALFDYYKAEFNKLRSYSLHTDSLAVNGILSPNGLYISISEAFYLYGLIAHYGKTGQLSLMPIFQDIQGDGLAKDLHSFEDKFNGIDIKDRENEIKPYIIPVKSLWEASSNEVYALNKDTMRIELYEKVDDKETTNDYGEEFRKVDIINGYLLKRQGKYIEEEGDNHFLYGDKRLAHGSKDYQSYFTISTNSLNKQLVTITYGSTNGTNIVIEGDIKIDSTLLNGKQYSNILVTLQGLNIIVTGNELIGGTISNISTTIFDIKHPDMNFNDIVLESWNGSIQPSRIYYELISKEILKELENGCIKFA